MFRRVATHRVSRVRVALMVGLAVTLGATLLVLSQSPTAVLATNSAASAEAILNEITTRSATICQANERLPQGTVAIRLSLNALTGPAVSVRATAGGRPITSGKRASGWSGATVTVPVTAVSHTVGHATICATSNHINETIDLLGSQTSSARAAYWRPRETYNGRMGISYLGAGRSSWLALPATVARHMALGRAWSGTWVALLLLALMLATAALATRLVLIELDGEHAVAARRALSGRWGALRRVPTAAWICALIACANAVGWSFITPPFQVPDEPDHFAYVKQLAETGTLPKTNAPGSYTPEEQFALEALHYSQVRLRPANQPIFSQAEQSKLERGLSAFNRSPKQGSPNAGFATSEPPLYYALESIPYRLSSSGNLLDRLQLMRLVSALMAGLTALFTFLFLRETLPGVRWAWTVGALTVALSPMFGFMSGSVNPDAMLFAVSAALFYCLARAFQRGVTTRWAIVTGIVIAAGFMTKLNFVGLAPGVLLALGIIALRGWRNSGRGALLAPAVAGAIGVVPIITSLTLGVGFKAQTHEVVSSTLTSIHGSTLDAANYIWQLYLPRLPGMTDYFPGLSPIRQLWLDGYIGRFGWLDTFFPGWVYAVALAVVVIIAGLLVYALLANRQALRTRVPELCVYLCMSLGLMVLIGTASFAVFPRVTAEYGQVRYLFPLLPLLGAVVALATRVAGRRWGPTVGATIIVLLFAHDLFSQLQTIARYYG